MEKARDHLTFHRIHTQFSYVGGGGERDRNGERASICIFVGVPFISSVADVAWDSFEKGIEDGRDGDLMGLGW